MTNITITNREFLNIIESKSYEVQARVEILAFIFSKKDVPAADVYKDYLAEYDSFFVEYQLMKSEVEQKYVRPQMKNLPVKEVLIEDMPNVDKNLCSELQAAVYLSEARKELIATLLESGASKNNITFLQNELSNALLKKARLMNELYKNSVRKVQPENFSNLEWNYIFANESIAFYEKGKTFSWQLDFSSGEVEIW